MKKFFVYLLVVLMLGAVLSFTFSGNTVKEQTPVVDVLLEVFSIPQNAYAQDTGNGGTAPPPFIPRDP